MVVVSEGEMGGKEVLFVIYLSIAASLLELFDSLKCVDL